MIFEDRLKILRKELSETNINKKQTSFDQEKSLQRYISTLLHDLHTSFQSKQLLQQELLEQCTY